MKLVGILAVVGAGCATGDDDVDSTNTAQASQSPLMEVSAAVQHDMSQPLRNAPAFTAPARTRKEHPIGRFRIAGPELNDAVVQAAHAAQLSAPTTPGLNFAGVGNGDYGFDPNSAPPDTNGVVGATQYVQWVNQSFAVFDKTTGAIAAGFPKNGNSLWAGFGGGCQNNNDGDPLVQYDKAANRWILSQFSVSTTPFLQCVAVSTTSDATGTYARYAFQYANFPDYPKMGVWPDGYYISFNIFGNSFLGGLACAYDRTKMLAGLPANQICFGPISSFASPLPSDLDGSTAPPAGSPNFFVNLQTTTSLNLFKFHADFATPANSTFTGPTVITVPGFATAATVPQQDTSQRLDALSDRLMYRLAYRNIGGHEAMVVTHSVAGPKVRGVSTAGVRWYELRSPGTGTFSLFQSATFSPDTRHRWMGSAAMDKVGNIALGYSLSSGTTRPALGYATRTPADAPGTLANEVIFKQGTGSQLTGLSRWGDYSTTSIDPVDDCTFWFTGEYLKANGTFNWSTQITSFKVAGCQ